MIDSLLIRVLSWDSKVSDLNNFQTGSLFGFLTAEMFHKRTFGTIASAQLLSVMNILVVG